MPRRRFEIRNEKGLHARASARFVEVVERFDARVSAARDGLEVAGDSIMGLLMLAAAQGAHIEVSADGPEAEDSLDALQALIDGNFGEAR